MPHPLGHRSRCWWPSLRGSRRYWLRSYRRSAPLYRGRMTLHWAARQKERQPTPSDQKGEGSVPLVPTVGQPGRAAGASLRSSLWLHCHTTRARSLLLPSKPRSGSECARLDVYERTTAGWGRGHLPVLSRWAPVLSRSAPVLTRLVPVLSRSGERNRAPAQLATSPHTESEWSPLSHSS